MFSLLRKRPSNLKTSPAQRTYQQTKTRLAFFEPLEDRRVLAQLVSVGIPGELGDDASHQPSLSADGRYVAFQSNASNLVAGDTNGYSDIFVRDLQTGVTTLVSVDSSGMQANNHSYEPSISGDGRYVAFRSFASDLVAGDTNNYYDIFVRDLQTGATTLVSVDSSGMPSNNASYSPSISGDGRYVAFQSFASDLVAGDTNNNYDIFVRDLQTGVTTLVSVDSSGMPSNNSSDLPSISADGRYVAFSSSASDLVAGDTNGSLDIFVRDLQTGVTTLVSVDSSGMPSNNSSDGPSISADGRYVAFQSYASDLVAGDTNNNIDVFVRDLQTGVTTLVSFDSSGMPSNSFSESPSLSADGRYVAFRSYASDLVTGDTNNTADIFVRDLQTGVTTLVSVDSSGMPSNSNSDGPSLSADGRYVAFQSNASDLSPDDRRYNTDVFVHATGFSSNLHAPVFTSPDEASVFEHNYTFAIDVNATDADVPAQTLTYSISGGADAALFTIDSSTGVVSFVDLPDYEDPADANGDNIYEIEVTVSDGEAATAQNILITVNPVNDNQPYIASGNILDVDENSTLVLDIEAFDLDLPAETLEFSISGVDAAQFAIDSQTGVLTFVQPPDYEAPADADSNNTYELLVRVSDGYTWDEVVFTIYVRPVNDNPPEVHSGSTVSVPENSTVVVDIDATDADLPAPTLTYVITGGTDGGLFDIDSTTGVLSFVDAPDYELPQDANANNVYEVEVTVIDGSFGRSQTFFVSVLPLNEFAPEITSPDLEPAILIVPEGTAYVADVDATDADSPSATLTYSIVDSQPANLFQIDPQTGVLSFITAPDLESPSDYGPDMLYVVDIAVTDGEFTTVEKVLIAIERVNEFAPVIQSSAVVNVDENSTIAVNVNATDADLPAEELVYSISGGVDAGLFTIDSNTGLVTFIAPPDYENPADADEDNVYSLQVTVTDGELSTVQDVTITVTPVNDNSPTIIVDSYPVVDENESIAFDIDATDADLPGDTLVYLLTGADAHLFTVDSNGVVSFITPPDYENPDDADGDRHYQLVAVVYDGFNTDTNLITLQLSPVNDHAPVIENASVDVSVDENSTVAIDVNATDDDLPSATLLYSISGGADAAKFTIDSTTGVVSFVSAPDYEMPSDADGDRVYELQVTVSDGGLSTVQDVTIAILPVNDNAPVFVTPSSLTMPENSTNVGDVQATDADLPAQTITYSILGGDDAARFIIDANTGALKFVEAPDFENPTDANGDNIYEVVVVASDGDISTSQAISVQVVDVPEYDYGDAPDSYGTLVGSNGPRHIAGALRLGSVVDVDDDGQPHANALGDDANGDDEDGVVVPSLIIPRYDATFLVNASAAGKLDAWLDFNRNGVFDANEQIAASWPVVAGSNTLTFEVPGSAGGGLSFARFRLSSTGGLSPYGIAEDGEVEDHAVVIALPNNSDAWILNDPAIPGNKLVVIQGTGNADPIQVRPSYTQPGMVDILIASYTTVVRTYAASSFQTILVFGHNGNDTITIDASLTHRAIVYGDAGIDTIRTAQGNDVIWGGDGDDTIYAGAGNDRINGDQGADWLYGEGGDDILQGSAGNDSLVGGAGRDILVGGAGADSLTGNEHDDLLIGAEWWYYHNSAALLNIQAKWLANTPIATRAASLADEINATTVQNDGVIDSIFGNAGADWFFDPSLQDFHFDYWMLEDRKN